MAVGLNRSLTTARCDHREAREGKRLHRRGTLRHPQDEEDDYCCEMDTGSGAAAHRDHCAALQESEGQKKAAATCACSAVDVAAASHVHAEQISTRTIDCARSFALAAMPKQLPVRQGERDRGTTKKR